MTSDIFEQIDEGFTQRTKVSEIFRMALLDPSEDNNIYRETLRELETVPDEPDSGKIRIFDVHECQIHSITKNSRMTHSRLDDEEEITKNRSTSKKEENNLLKL